ncbi:hypothetical protein CDFC105_30342 [Clostridioides difficile]|nr:hypothetical protein CDFC105_30342 [Clostridioides difficile]
MVDIFFFEWCGDHRDLHVRSRRQRQMCIRDRDTLIIDEYGEVEDLAYNLKSKKEVKDSSWNMSCLLYTSPSPRDS